ncbi:MAG: Trehalose/maltose import ATP-binding protein MalK [Candidatus Heimdallarchaeota archaeon AB_125]|nr:MAG: Trehalose/maltose import ATP-binding protein MalK [Candidatus Heimdallarchaeota archaeon AB_125]
MKIETKNLTKIYGKKIALNDINLTIPDGSFTVILGPSGSGKTTLLRILAGLLYPSDGKVFFNENNITDIPANKRNIAMVFQNFPLFPHMTVEENLGFSLESQKEGNLFRRRIFTPSDVQTKVDETLELFKLEDHRNKYPSQLSGGEQQRVAIGREVIRKPVVFLFDEPLSNIDARLRYEMRTWIRKLHGIVKTTMVYVTHDQAEALSLGDNIILLNEGEITQMGSPEDLYDNPNQKFVAQFIGNYPMNFLQFKSSKNTLSLTLDKEITLPKKIQKELSKIEIAEGEIGFRAESIREVDPDKTIDENQIVIDCSVVDSEKILDQQVLTLDFNGETLIFVTKTKKKFTVGHKLSILLHVENLYIFTRDNKRAF